MSFVNKMCGGPTTPGRGRVHSLQDSVKKHLPGHHTDTPEIDIPPPGMPAEGSDNEFLSARDSTNHFQFDDVWEAAPDTAPQTETPTADVMARLFDSTPESAASGFSPHKLSKHKSSKKTPTPANSIEYAVRIAHGHLRKENLPEAVRSMNMAEKFLTESKSPHGPGRPSEFL